MSYEIRLRLIVTNYTDATFDQDLIASALGLGVPDANWEKGDAYDAENEQTSVTDADGNTSYRCYYLNGLVEQDQSAHQNTLDGGTVCGSHSVSYVYDTDGDAWQTTRHYGNVAGVTTNWYDGLDRLVEVKQPTGNQINLGFWS